MHTRYSTPADLAHSMGAELPNNAAVVLDPAVGDGALLAGAAAFVDGATFIGVDIDGGVREDLRNRLETCGIGDSFRFIRSDFLRLSSRALRRGWKEVDAIIMNPPFLARRSRYVETVDSDEPACGGSKAVPIEVLFVIRSIAMLRAGGTLVALLPRSIVAGDHTASVRKWMAIQGTVEKIHELPDGVFQGVESRFFVIVFRKGVFRGRAELLNHKIPGVVLGEIGRDKLLGGIRWDYSWFEGVQAVQNAYAKFNLGWASMSTVATVTRGRAITQNEKRTALHTCDYKNAAWHAKGSHIRVESASRGVAKQGDFALARVGRDCIDSFGYVMCDGAVPASDCVFVIRPNTENGYGIEEILFAVRCWLKCEGAQAYLVRGTACRFLSKNDIADLRIPFGLAARMPSEFQEYRQVIERGDHIRRAEIEVTVAAYIETSDHSI